MFDWLFGAPACPVEPQDRTWLEGRTRWLVGEFGLSAARSARMVLPTPEFFPDPYDATRPAARRLIARVCRYMGVDPTGLEVGFLDAGAPPGEGHREWAAGLYESDGFSVRVSIDEASLADPLAVVATAAHELAHVLLLGQGRLYGDEPDNEQVTDLLTVYLGFGVFTANSRVRDRTTRSVASEQWSISRLGYLDQPQVGYALALWARLRGEGNPPWSRHLCADVRAYLKRGLRWLARNGDAVLDPETGSPTSLSDDDLPPGFNKRR